MLNIENIDFETIIKNKMQEDRADFLTADAILENNDEDTELLLAMLPLKDRKIPDGYILNPAGIDKLKELLKNLESIMMYSDVEHEIEIEAVALDYDSLSVNVECDSFIITQYQKPNFLKILSLSKTVDIYARTDSKMVVSIMVSDCLAPILF